MVVGGEAGRAAHRLVELKFPLQVDNTLPYIYVYIDMCICVCECMRVILPEDRDDRLTNIAI